MNTRKLAFLITLTALCLAIQLTPRPPNAEFTSFFVFVMGLTEGAFVGALCGTFIMTINGFLSPVGFGGLVIPFQITGMIVAAVFGSVYRRFTSNLSFSSRFSIEASVLGAVIALVYDLITNFGVGVGYILAGAEPFLALVTAFATGSFYSLIHIASNTVVFGVLFLPVTNALSGLKVGDFTWSKKERLYS